jgi:monoterpene epsilon-lactone hydrolase
MRSVPRSRAAIQAWQRSSPLWDTPTRIFRLALSIALIIAQLPLVALDVLSGTTRYGRPRWPFHTRCIALITGYVIWTVDSSTRPISDVESYSARSNPGRLTGKKRAKIVDVPARPDKLFGDALFDGMVPESCPCFWQWVDGDVVSPFEDTTPIEERRVILYFVGGGMVHGHPCKNPIQWKMAQTTGVPLFGVNYRKCVTRKTAFPAALQDAVAAFYYLLDEGYRAQNITIAGDSAGGGIAITVLLYLKRHALELPGSAVLSSPFVDLVDDFTGDKELTDLDFLTSEFLVTVEYQYTENRPDLRATLLSPALNNLPEGYTFDNFPRALVVYGDAEMFAPGIIETIKVLREAGVDVEVNIGKDMIHNPPTYTYDKSENGFYGRLKPFLLGQGRYEDLVQEDMTLG